MANTGKEFVDFATGMLNKNINELEARVIINRAYYGAHHEAKIAANISNHKHDCHRAVISHYNETNKIISNKLDNLFKSRKKADYDIHLDVATKDTTLFQEAELSCIKAKFIIDELVSESKEKSE